MYGLVVSQQVYGVLALPAHDLLCRWEQTKGKLTEAELDVKTVLIVEFSDEILTFHL